jgi:hypothetical protein
MEPLSSQGLRPSTLTILLGELDAAAAPLDADIAARLWLSVSTHV